VITPIRLLARQFRLEFIVFGAAFGLAIAATVAAGLYAATLPVAACPIGITTPGCASTVAALETLGPIFVDASMLVLPIAVLAGLLLGVGLVSREIEGGTASLAWTLSPSRRHWLIPRVLILAGALVAASAAAGLALDYLLARLDPTIPLGESFRFYEQRGWLIPARALVAFAVGSLTGAIVGRGLQAFLVAILVGALALGGPFLAASRLNAMDARPLSDALNQLIVDDRLVFYDRATGTLMDQDAANAIIPVEDPTFPDRFEIRHYALPGPASPLVIGREVAMDGGLALVALLLMVGVVERRRPY
jgi:ABC-type transport system involved in multi-copper enzyme maturation permease subunit